MAEHADDGFLLYLLDMAILEANRRARDKGESRDKAQFLDDGNSESNRTFVAELKVVR